MDLLADADATDRVAELHEVVAAALGDGYAEVLRHDAVVLRRAADWTRDFADVLEEQ